MLDVVNAIISLSEVAGNQSRFLYDFSPDSVIFRWTDDFAPRLLYGFQPDAGGHLSAPEIIRRVASGDIVSNELIIGGSLAELADGKTLSEKGCCVLPGVKAAAEEVKSRIKKSLALI